MTTTTTSTVKIGTETFELVEVIDLTESNLVPSHSTEMQYTINDHITHTPTQLKLTLKLYKRGSTSEDGTTIDYSGPKTLLALNDARKAYKVITPIKTVSTMAITDIAMKDSDSENIVYATVELIEIRQATHVTTTNSALDLSLTNPTDIVSSGTIDYSGDSSKSALTEGTDDPTSSGTYDWLMYLLAIPYLLTPYRPESIGIIAGILAITYSDDIPLISGTIPFSTNESDSKQQTTRTTINGTSYLGEWSFNPAIFNYTLKMTDESNGNVVLNTTILPDTPVTMTDPDTYEVLGVICPTTAEEGNVEGAIFAPDKSAS